MKVLLLHPSQARSRFRDARTACVNVEFVHDRRSISLLGPVPMWRPSCWSVINPTAQRCRLLIGFRTVLPGASARS